MASSTARQVRVVCLDRHADRWVESSATRFGVRIAANGSYQIVPWCSVCERWASNAVPHWGLIDRPAELPVIADNRGTIGRCSVRGCPNEAVEDHHFAPRAIFRDEADDWLRGLLCVAHHQEWHRRMGAA